jgi:hypothetical protein
MRRSRLAAFVAATFALGCASTPQPAAPVRTPAAHDDAAPYPYTADQIRAACHGRVVEYRMEAAGAPTTTQHWEFADVDAQTARITTTTFDADGKSASAPEVETSTWAELHEHARFPHDATTITSETITIPAGTFASARYVVTSGGVVKTLWFAHDLAGPPLKLVVTKGGHEVMSMTMLTTRTR